MVRYVSRNSSIIGGVNENTVLINIDRMTCIELKSMWVDRYLH